jgi:hypothetical protein
MALDDAPMDEDLQGGPGRYAYAPNGSVSGAAVLGNENRAARGERFGLAPSRSAMFGFKALQVLDTVNYLRIVALTADIDVYTIGSGNPMTATAGGIPGASASEAETMAGQGANGQGGGLVRNKATFKTVGASCSKERGWYSTSATEMLATRIWPAWMDDGQGGFCYVNELQEQIMDAAYVSLELFGGTTLICTERLGRLGDWMSRTNAGQIELPGNFLALANEYGSGGETSDAKIKLKISMPRQINVQERAGLPLPGVDVGAVAVPFSFKLFGYVVCGVPAGEDDVCGDPMQEVRQMRRELADMKRRMAGG